MYPAFVIGASIGFGAALGAGIGEMARRQRLAPRPEENSYNPETGLVRGTGALKSLPADAYVKDVYIENVPFARHVGLLRNRALENLKTITITGADLDDATFKRAMEALPKIPPVVDVSNNNITDVSPAITPETDYTFFFNNEINGHKLAEFMRKYPRPVRIDVRCNRHEFDASEIQDISDAVRHSCVDLWSNCKEVEAAILQRNMNAHAAYRDIGHAIPEPARTHIGEILTYFNPRTAREPYLTAYDAANALADIINGEYEGMLRGMFARREP